MIRRSPQNQGFHLGPLTDGSHPVTDEVLEVFRSLEQSRRDREQDPAWREHNLEYDLRSSDNLCQKARERPAYAQNIYAALCNNEFQKQHVWPVLKGQTWCCTWRYAGGIVADMLEKGDYMDRYRSVIHPTDLELTPEEKATATPEQLARAAAWWQFVPEGCVTDEVRQDLAELGWRVLPEPD